MAILERFEPTDRTAIATPLRAEPDPEERMAEPRPEPPPFATIVTGLPRSGTSMLMQMLGAGGLPLLSDGRRPADADNPRGYYELEAATRLARDHSWLGQAAGRGVKIVVPLVPHLPRGHRYRVIFVQRDLDEVLASQEVMLARRSRAVPTLATGRLREIYREQLREAEAWLAAQPSARTLFVRHRETLAAPEQTALALERFLGGLDVVRMAAAVVPGLHRQRRKAPA